MFSSKAFVPPVRPFLYNLKVFQSSASAPRRKYGGVRKKHLITLDPTSWSMKEVTMRRTRQPDYRALTLSLSHRSFMVGLRYSPWYVRDLFNTVRYIDDLKKRSFV